jgi:hypothetical protein
MIITTRGFKKPADTEPYAVKDSNDNVDNLELILDAVDLEMDQLFQSVSNGKALVAGAITDKGVNTSPTDTFAVMAGNIDAIETDPSIGTTDAVAGDILLGKKVVSQGNIVTGSMPNNGPAVAETVNLTNHNQEYTIAQGSHSGLRKIKAVITNLAAGVIKAGVTVGGILGTFTSDATATAAQMLAGAKAYVNGILVTGTIPSKGAQTYTPGTTNQIINAGQYLSGNQTIQGSANFVEGNIKDGVNLFGKIGNYKASLNVVGSAVNFTEFNNRFGGISYEILKYYPNYTKVVEIEFILPVSGTLNVNYKFRGASNPGTFFIRLYKNGVAIGTERTLSSFNEVVATDSVSVVPGDKLALYVKQYRDTSDPRLSYLENLNLGMTVNGSSEIFKVTYS